MSKLASILILLAFSAVAQIEEAAITNEYIVSQTVRQNAWLGQPVMAGEDGRVIDASGVLVEYAEAVAQSNTIARIGDISSNMVLSVRGAINYLCDHTNNIPDASLHIALEVVPRGSRSNLVALVIGEWVDGDYDYQAVHYNRSLAVRPNRKVEYHHIGGVALADCEWVDWSASGISTNGFDGVHICRIKRPAIVRGLPCKTDAIDTLGGDNGFAFGALAVTVDDELTYTGMVTNRESGEVWAFDNGVLMR